MKEQFCDYETSRKLKELGFNAPCIALHGEGGFNCGMIKNSKNSNWQNPVCTAPLWQQVRQWIWDNHKAFIRLEFDDDGYYVPSLISEDGNLNFVLNNKKVHDYIEAENDAIKDAVEWLHKNIEK